ncbi:unnamed protein product, partial [Prorocentrum cordatum]
MYAEKVRSVANRPGAKAQTYVRDCCGVSVKALFVLGHRVAVDYLAGRASVDGWIHCQAAARDAAMLLGLRRRLQEVLQRLLSKPSFEVPGGEDQEVINAVTSLLVMDIERALGPSAARGGKRGAQVAGQLAVCAGVLDMMVHKHGNHVIQ